MEIYLSAPWITINYWNDNKKQSIIEIEGVSIPSVIHGLAALMVLDDAQHFVVIKSDNHFVSIYKFDDHFQFQWYLKHKCYINDQNDIVRIHKNKIVNSAAFKKLVGL